MASPVPIRNMTLEKSAKLSRTSMPPIPYSHRPQSQIETTNPATVPIRAVYAAPTPLPRGRTMSMQSTRTRNPATVNVGMRTIQFRSGTIERLGEQV